MKQSAGEREQGKVLVHRLENDVKRCAEHEKADAAEDVSDDAEAEERFVRQDVKGGMRRILDGQAREEARVGKTYSYEDQGKQACESCNLRGLALWVIDWTGCH
jgi:hypothetical protein